MKNNLALWADHYEEILTKYYYDFCQMFLDKKGRSKIQHSELIGAIPEYKEFVIFVYKNTKKTIINLPGVFDKELRAPIL